MNVTGTPELQRRLKAIRLTFKVGGRGWADDAADLMRAAVPRRTGTLARSFRRRNATQRKATVVGHYTAYFVDGGTVAHPIRPRNARRLRWEDSRGRTIFARKVDHPRTRPRPFRDRAAREAYARRPLGRVLVELWNRAA